MLVLGIGWIPELGQREHPRSWYVGFTKQQYFTLLLRENIDSLNSGALYRHLGRNYSLKHTFKLHIHIGLCWALFAKFRSFFDLLLIMFYGRDCKLEFDFKKASLATVLRMEFVTVVLQKAEGCCKSLISFALMYFTNWQRISQHAKLVLHLFTRSVIYRQYALIIVIISKYIDRLIHILQFQKSSPFFQ